MFRPYMCGHLQVVTGLSGQLYRNAWSVLGGFWGKRGSRSHYNRGYHDTQFFSGGLPFVVCSALFLKMGTAVMLGTLSINLLVPEFFF